MSGTTRGNLRRSSRAPKKTATSEYAVGDLVEINRGGTIVHVRLAQLLTEISSPNPRWLIRFEGSLKDEEVYEHTFSSGKLSNGESPTSGTNTPIPASDPESTRGPAQKKKKKSGGNTGSDTSSSSSNNNNKTRDDPQENVSDSSNAKNSAREARSRRRQAMIDETKISVLANNNEVQQQPATATFNANSSRKRKLSGAAKQSNAKSKRERKKKDEQDCVKIKLLTGTLYLYRGRHRRAEFVRRV